MTELYLYSKHLHDVHRKPFVIFVILCRYRDGNPIDKHMPVKKRNRRNYKLINRGVKCTFCASFSLSQILITLNAECHKQPQAGPYHVCNCKYMKVRSIKVVDINNVEIKCQLDATDVFY
jgi:hypothetical protein